MFKRMMKNTPVRKKRTEYEEIVQDGLAITPSQMSAMAARGEPITPRTLGAEFYDGKQTNDFDVDILYQRGVDIVDVYETSMRSKENIRKGMQKINQNNNKSSL